MVHKISPFLIYFVLNQLTCCWKTRRFSGVCNVASPPGHGGGATIHQLPNRQCGSSQRGATIHAPNGNLRGPPQCHVYPQEIAGPNKALLRGNQWTSKEWDSKLVPSLKLKSKAPKNGWLEYYFPIGDAYFQVRTVSFGEGKHVKSTVGRWSWGRFLFVANEYPYKSKDRLLWMHVKGTIWMQFVSF